MRECIEKNHLNTKMLLEKSKYNSDVPLYAAETDGPDPYFGAGSHPDIVQRVWVEIGKSFPSESRCRIYGSPALCNPETGLVFAICRGTQYCIRVPATRLAEARDIGLKETTTWSAGSTTNVCDEYGSGWLFGAWHAKEAEFCKEVFESGCA